MVSLNPLVSIVIPVYNGSNYMREAIDSALAQTYSDIEIIVVNDGSNDGGETRRIAHFYGERIRYFEKENGGVSTALNLALRNMKGEYFSWLSHDDIYHPNKISAEMTALKAHGDMRRPVYTDHTFLAMPQKYMYAENVPFYANKTEVPGLGAIWFAEIFGCELLIHKNYFQQYGLFDESLRCVQDTMKWFQMFQEEYFVHVSEPLTISRVHAEQVSSIGSTRMVREKEQLFLYMVQHVTEHAIQNMGMNRYQYLSMAFEIIVSHYASAGSNASQYVYKELCLCEEPKDTDRKLQELRAYLASFGATRYYIYCAGVRGRRLLLQFLLRDLPFDGIVDSDKNKWGTSIWGCLCLSPAHISLDALMIISKANPSNVKKELKSKGYSRVITYDDLLEQLVYTPPKKDMVHCFMNSCG